MKSLNRCLTNTICDICVILFAAWTVVCNVVVLSGGNLITIIISFSLAIGLVASFISVFRRGRGVLDWIGRDKTVEVLPVCHSVQSHSHFSGLDVIIIPVVACLIYFYTQNYKFFWLLVIAYFIYVLLRQTPPLAVFGIEKEREFTGYQWLNPKYLLVILSVFCVILTLVSHHPNIDDTFYINMAVSAADQPYEQLMSQDTLHGLKNPFSQIAAFHFYSFELLGAAGSYLTGIDAMKIVHLLLAGIAGGLIALVNTRLFRHLLPENWIWGVVTLVGIYMFTGDSHQWYSNMAFVRLFQGKALFPTIMVPLIISYSIEFANKKGKKEWFLLLCSQIAAVGLTSSACLFAPVTMLFALVASLKIDKKSLKTLFFGSLASLYPLFAGLYIKIKLSRIVSRVAAPEVAKVNLPPMNPAIVNNIGNIKSFFRETEIVSPILKSFFSNDALLTICLIAMLTAWIFTTSSFSKRFTLTYSLLFFLTFLNPFASSLFLKKLIGRDSFYWRMLWVFPTPVFLGLFLLTPINMRSFNKYIRTGFFLLIVCIFFTFVPNTYSLSKKNNTSLKFPDVKVPENFFDVTRQFNSYVESKNVIAPFSISTLLPTLHKHAYPLMTRKLYLQPLAANVGIDDAYLRYSLTQYVSGSKRIEAISIVFKGGIERYNIKGIVHAPGILWKDELHALMVRTGFVREKIVFGYEIWIRS